MDGDRRVCSNRRELTLAGNPHSSTRAFISVLVEYSELVAEPGL